MADIFVTIETDEAIATVNINGAQFTKDTDGNDIPNPAQALAVGATLATAVDFPITLNGIFPSIPNEPIGTLDVDQRGYLAVGHLLINAGITYPLTINSIQKGEGSLSND